MFNVAFPNVFSKSLLVVAGLAIAGGVWAKWPAKSCTPVCAAASSGETLRLDIESQTTRTCFYGSQFNMTPTLGERMSGLSTSKYFNQHLSVQGTTTWNQEYEMYGCTWHATETLVPEGDGRFHYTYTEYKDNCSEEALPSFACTRTGTVTYENQSRFR